MKILYFAWLRTKTGVAEEDVTPPAEVGDVAALIEWLKGRGDFAGFGEAGSAGRGSIFSAVSWRVMCFSPERR